MAVWNTWLFGLCKFLKGVSCIATIIFFLLISNSCKKEPDISANNSKPLADFIFDIKNSGTLPTRIIFTSIARNAKSYKWDFGDGKTSSKANSENSYQNAGTYSVKLVVSNQHGQDSIVKSITISQNKPKANFTYSIVNEGQLPCTVNFKNSSQDAGSFQWYFGDGKSSFHKDTQNTYANNKTYLVKLVVTNTAGKDSITKEVTVNPIINSVLVYLITPKDRQFNQQYYDAVKACALNLQGWYKQQMGSKTFVLNPSVLDTLTGLHNADWYNSNNGSYSGTDPRFYAYFNTFYEMQRLLGARFNTSKYVNLVYVAAPGGGAGATGFCAMGDQDLKGLLGQNQENLNKNRWVGGGGHELGHAFGLPHPDNQNWQALMWTGYTIYPNCILQQEDKNVLNASPFFK